RHLQGWLRRTGLGPRPRLRELYLLLAEHDPPTAAHCLRVCHYALWLADELGLRRPQRAQLALAAWLHDVGKLFTPRSVLNSASPLTPEEYRHLQQHPALGVFLLQAVLPPSPALDAVRSHHEQPDGRGYPDGLKGDEVPLLA